MFVVAQRFRHPQIALLIDHTIGAAAKIPSLDYEVNSARGLTEMIAKRRRNRHLVTYTLAGRYPLRPATGSGRAAASKYAFEFDKNGRAAGNSGLTGIEVSLDQKHFRRRTPI